MTDSNQRNNHSGQPSAWDDSRVTAFVLGELSQSEAAEFESQMKMDSALASAVDEARQVTDQLKVLFEEESTVRLDEDRREKILVAPSDQELSSLAIKSAEMAGHGSNRSGSNRSRQVLIVGIVATAASLLAAIFVAPDFMRAYQHSVLSKETTRDSVKPLRTVLETASEKASNIEAVVESSRANTSPRSESSGLAQRVLVDQSRRASSASTTSGFADDGKNVNRSPASDNSNTAGTALDRLALGPEPVMSAALQNESTATRTATHPVIPSRGTSAKPVPSSTKAEATWGGYAGGLADEQLSLSGDVSEIDGDQHPFGDMGMEEGMTMDMDMMMELDMMGGGAEMMMGGEMEMMGPDQMGMGAGQMDNAGMGGMMEATPPANRGAQFGGKALNLSIADSSSSFGMSATPASAPPQREAKIESESSRLGLQELSDVRAKQQVEFLYRENSDAILAKQPTRVARRTKTLRQVETNESIIADEYRVDRQRFDPISENEFKKVAENPKSTFSIDVDTASYSKVRRSVLNGRLPSPNAVRIEELVNYFDYSYEAPGESHTHPFSTQATLAQCPWNPQHLLARVALQGRTLNKNQRPPCNLVFLLDTSGSMNSPSKLPLVIEGMKMLTDQLTEKDRVAIVVYAGSAGMVLDSTPANKKKKIGKALSRLSAGGSTNGGAGIQLAYATARDNFITDGVNRVILCTDGDFNVGISGTKPLVQLVKEESSGGIFLTALGFGMDNHNDGMMEQISGKGNGNYAFIDTANEARKVLVRQTESTLVTIAKDVKIQIEFNPRVISRYRLIGYENRVMATKDFDNDKKDAGEIGAGHQVTALYELIPNNHQSDKQVSAELDDGLKYQKTVTLSDSALGDETMTIALRYKLPNANESTRLEVAVKNNFSPFAETDQDFQFASAVASFGMQLRGSDYAGDWNLGNVLDVAQNADDGDKFGLRNEFLDIVRRIIRLNR